MKINDQTWLGAHLYYNRNNYEFLILGVKPFVKFVLEKGLAKGYFFIRYKEKGPHIRLRFRGDKEKLQSLLKPEIDKYFFNYYKQYPSKRKQLYDFNETWYPDSSIQYIEYKPETERYGGTDCMQVSEILFQKCSDAVLSLLSEGNYQDWRDIRERAIGAAIQLHLVMCSAFELNNYEIRYLFEMVTKNWLHASYNISGSVVSKDQIQEYTDLTISIFEKKFNMIKSVLIPLHEGLIYGCRENVSFDEEWLNRWFYEMKIIYQKLISLIRNKRLVLPQYFKTKNNINISKEKQKLFYLMHSYIHMTNNRVGVLNHNESFIAYLIKRSLESSSSIK